MEQQQKNGFKTWALKWLVGIVWLIVFTTLTTIAGHVIANDQRNTKDHVEIRKEVDDKIERIVERFERKQERLEDRVESYQIEQRAVNEKILDKLDKIRTR